jgi:hypothetical protein
MAGTRIESSSPRRWRTTKHLDQESYEESLALLDPITHAQLRHGDWSIRPPGYWMFDSDHIAAAVELGHEYDRKLARGALLPSGNCVNAGVDFGDYQTVLIPTIELPNDGVYFAPTEVVNSREDLEVITKDFKAAMDNFDWWWAELRYDASFKQSARTVASLLTKSMGQHNSVLRRGRPNTYPCSFGDYKDLGIKYIRLLLARTYRQMNKEPWLDGKPILDRIGVISPQNKLFKRQLEGATGKETDPEKMEKGDDDAVDAGIAAVVPLARKHRKLIQDIQEELKAPQAYEEGVEELTEEQVA